MGFPRVPHSKPGQAIICVHASRCVPLGFGCKQPANENCQAVIWVAVFRCVPAVWRNNLNSSGDHLVRCKSPCAPGFWLEILIKLLLKNRLFGALCPCRKGSMQGPCRDPLVALFAPMFCTRKQTCKVFVDGGRTLVRRFCGKTCLQSC